MLTACPIWRVARSVTTAVAGVIRKAPVPRVRCTGRGMTATEVSWTAETSAMSVKRVIMAAMISLAHSFSDR